LTDISAPEIGAGGGAVSEKQRIGGHCMETTFEEVDAAQLQAARWLMKVDFALVGGGY